MADSARTTRAAALEEKKRRLEELKQRRALRSEAPTATAPQQNLDEYIDGLLASPAPAEDAAKEEVPPLQEEGDTAPAPPLQDQKPKQPLEAPPSAQPAVTLAAPKVETFEFGTQTNDEDFVRDDEDEAADEEERGRVETADESQVPEGHPEAPIALEPRILSEEEKQETVDKVQFSSFLNTASKKVERILGEPVLAELLVNVVGETDGLEIEDKKTTSQFVSARHAFSHPKWTAGRTVTDIAWSNLHRELLLSSYDTLTSGGTGLLRAVSPDVTPSASLAPRSGELQSDGLVVVWNLALPTRPEHVLTCGSPVHAARFHPTTSPLIVGGCRNGQLVVWDVRAGRLPVQRSGQGYPITSMQVGEGNAGLVTTSTDGKLCFWSLANLRDPAETVTLDGNLSCLAVASNSTVVCGDEVGTLFVVPAKRKQVQILTDTHFGLVTAVSVRNKQGLILSSGVDWTVKLMHSEGKSSKTVWSSMSHSYDYISDVQWNPVHPSLMATSSSNGKVTLWNLADSTDKICGEIVVEETMGLNKLRWSDDGKRLLVATSEDRIHVLSLTDEVWRQKGDEEERMMKNLAS